MTPVDFSTKDLERFLKWFGRAFSGSTQPDEEDINLRNKTLVMYNEEKEWDKAETE